MREFTQAEIEHFVSPEDKVSGFAPGNARTTGPLRRLACM